MIERTPRGTYRPVIMDFGLAREASDGKGLTESGAVMGTPAYMSPEQARGETRRLERRSDVYSLGATLYDILAGVPPFEDATVMNILLKVITDDPKPLRDVMPGAPEALDTIVGKCLNKEPEQRYASALELADDLSRFLSNQRIVGKRLSLTYRIAYRARRNKPVAALMLTLLICLLGFAGAAVRSRLATLRQERAAQAEAEQAQKLGRYVKDLEWLVRTAYSLPLHDTTPDKAFVRERMAEIDSELRGSSEAGLRLGHYVLGRGHLALHEWPQAYEHLTRAAALGHKDLELDYALGRVLGEKFSQGLEDARKSGDKSFFEKRRKELEVQYLQPALAYLQKSRNLKTVSTSYLEGLIDYYNQRYDAALINAHFAQRQIPWLYEAIQLEGDVYMARALDQKDSGDTDQADRNFQSAIAHYERATQFGRSDYRLYEAIAEVYIRQEEMDLYRGKDPQPKLQNALLAAERTIEASAKESYGYTKQAFAYLFVAKYEQGRGNGEGMLSAVAKMIAAGEKAVKVHTDDEYAHEAIGLGHLMVGTANSGAGKEYESDFELARRELEKSIKIKENFPWAYNDIGISHMLEGSAREAKNQSPLQNFDQAINYFKHALTIDPNYYQVHANMAYIYANLSVWHFEHGQDPTAAIHDAAHAAQSSIKIDPKTFVPYWNMAATYTIGVMYKYYSSQNLDEYTKSSQSMFNELFAITDSVPDVYVDYMNLHYIQALSQLQQKKDPASSIREGRKAAARCHRANNGTHYGCAAMEALLLSVAGRAAPSDREAFTQGLELAHTAKQHGEKDPNILIAVAEACHRSAQARLEFGRPLGNELNDGLSAVEQALVLSPGWPRALALHGALLWLRARQQPGSGARTSWIGEARASLTLALRDNQWLRSVYGATLREAEKGAGEAAATEQEPRR